MQANINLEPLIRELKINTSDDGKKIWDPVRKKWFILYPEELVRQLVICYLTKCKNYSTGRIAVEKSITVNGLQKRFDIAVMDEMLRPYLLIECKAFNTNIRQSVFDQIARYQSTLDSTYLMVTNGAQSFCFYADHEKKQYQFLDDIP